MRSRSRLRVSVAAVWLLVVAAIADAAGAQRLRMTIDRSELTIGESAILEVTVEGSLRAKPRLPELPDFEVHHLKSRSEIDYVNGRVSRHITHRWSLTPVSTGEFRIGPAEVEIGGQLHASRSLAVRVLPASRRPPEPAAVFVSASVSERRPFVGQQVLYSWRFYHRVRVAGARLDPLDLDPFLVEDLGEVRKYRTTWGGSEYQVSELRKALFAQRPGRVVLPATRLQVEVVAASARRRRPSPFDDFFGSRVETESRVLRSEPIELEVRPLPPSPPGFSGLVGSFTVATWLSDSEPVVGESVTQKITVSGAGNVHRIGRPDLATPPGFKVYEDEAATSLDRSGLGLEGSRTFSRALVPMAPGSATIPGVKLVYFDPSRESYEIASSPAVTVEVSPGAGREELRLTEATGSSGGREPVRILAEDVRPIVRDPESVRPRRLPSGLLWLVAPPLVFGLLAAVRHRTERSATDLEVQRRRRRRARHRALGALRRSRRDPEGVSAAAAFRILRHYIGDKAGREGGTLTAPECASILTALGVEPSTVAEVGTFLDELAAAQYGSRPDDGSGWQEERLRGLLRSLERQLGRSR